MVLETKYLRLHEYWVKTGRPIMTANELGNLSQTQLDLIYAEAALFFQTNRKTIAANACLICGFEGQVTVNNKWLCMEHSLGHKEIIELFDAHNYLIESGFKLYDILQDTIDKIVVDGICLFCKKDLIMGNEHDSNCPSASLLGLHESPFRRPYD